MPEGGSTRNFFKFDRRLLAALSFALAMHALLLAVWTKAGLAVHPSAPAAVRTIHAVQRVPAETPSALAAIESTRGHTRVDRRLGAPVDVAKPSAAGAESEVRHSSAEFIPAALLKQGPSVAGAVNIFRPAGELDHTAVTVYLTLFIDEQGSLVRASADDPEHYPAFAKAAIESFSSATFTPGRIGQRAVKSSMRIEVVFEPEVPVPTSR